MPTRLVPIFLGLATLSLSADVPWPDKSGPTKDGVVPVAHAKGLVHEWDEKSGKNVAWKTELPLEGHSIPVIDAKMLWFTSASADGGKQYLDGVDRATGELKHHHLVFENESPEPLGNKVNNYAAPSCVMDDTGLYVHFGTYGTAKMDPKTLEKKWERRDIHCSHLRGPGSSPVLYKNLLILSMDGADQQFVMALDKETGKTVWRTDRTTDYGDLGPDGKPQRDGDLRKAYGTPSIVKVGDGAHLVSVGSGALFGYDPDTGKELWTVTHGGFNAAVRPVSSDGLVFVNTGYPRAHLLAIRLDESLKGDVTKSHVVWEREKRNSDFSGHVLVGDRLIQSTEGGIVTCLDQKTGKELWMGRLPGTYVATPIVVGDLVFYSNESGQSRVLRAGESFEVVSENELDVGIQASAAVADGELYLRTKTCLYKIASGN